MAPGLPKRRAGAPCTAREDPVHRGRTAILDEDLVHRVVVILLVGLVFESHDAGSVVVTLKQFDIFSKSGYIILCARKAGPHKSLIVLIIN